MVDSHFGLGMWIRNNWIYGCPESVNVNDIPAFLDTMFEHPNSVSSKILEKYYDYLRVKSAKGVFNRQE